ncbi:S-layer homology domain-containing protein [Paenibacillus phytorum]|nr:S-layer homology domain-containing protein [Paenibacillus phytorum]
MKFLSRAIILVLCVIMIMPSFALGATNTSSTTSDMKGHWAEKEMAKWIDKGAVSGYSDGTYRPDHSISRAEFFTLVNRSFNYTQEVPVTFKDLSATHWASIEVARAKAAGYVAGYEDGTIHPDMQISREEAAVVLRTILKLNEDADRASSFKDAVRLAAWSKGSIGVLAANGYLAGYEDGTFKPDNSMTRAEVIVLLDRVLTKKVATTTFDQKGTFGPETGSTAIKGNVVISAPGVTLKNTIIEGDLLLAESIGEGDVFLKNVTVKGATTVNGGGSHSIHFEDSMLLTVIVNKVDGSIRIVAEGSTSVQQITLQSSALLEARGTGTIADVILSSLLPSSAEVSLAGQFNTLSVQATSIRVNLSEGSIQQLTVAQGAANSTLQVGAGASIAQLILNAATSITGSGTIDHATVNTNGSTFERTPTSVTNGDGVTAGSSSNSGGSSDDSPTVSDRVYGFEGRIVDVNNQPVSGMTIYFRRGLGNTDGEVAATAITDSNGHYSVRLSPGIYFGQLSKEGFITTYLVGVSAENVYNRSENETAIRVAAANEVRVVLTWGERPFDLDSHLVGPTPNGTTFHTWYGGRTYTVSGIVYDDLDHDDVTSYGPETTTIRRLVDGSYRFYVHNYSGTPSMQMSGAHIEVFVGSTIVPAKTYDIAAGTGTERYWTVFELNVLNGSIDSFTDINHLYANENDAQRLENALHNTTITSTVYGINQNSFEISGVAANTPVLSFKSRLTVSQGASFEVYESNGITPRAGVVLNGDKVIVTSADGQLKRTYTVVLTTIPTVTSLTYSPVGPIAFYTTAPSGVTVFANYSNGTVTDVTYSSGITYNSSNTNIVSIGQNGVMTAAASGTTVVSVVYGGVTKEIPVIVIFAPTLTSSSAANTLQASGLIVGAEVRLYNATTDAFITTYYPAMQGGTISIPAQANGNYYITQTFQGLVSQKSNPITLSSIQ